MPDHRKYLESNGFEVTETSDGRYVVNDVERGVTVIVENLEHHPKIVEKVSNEKRPEKTETQDSDTGNLNWPNVADL